MEIHEGSSHQITPRGSEDDFDFDSAFAEDPFNEHGSIFSGTTSLVENARAYRKLHGRRYQASVTTTYWGPMDEQQLEALEMTHHWMTLLYEDKLYLSPLDNPQNALDIGTATGIWATDFADENPQCMVIGTDISPIQPSWVPPNIRFHIEDAQLDWLFEPNHFDFIHMRHMAGCIDNWQKLYGQAFTHLAPGGWFEHVEYDIQMRSNHGELPESHIFKRWYGNFVKAGQITGQSFEVPVLNQGMPKLMVESGFTDVVHRTWKVPIGGWPSDRRMRELGLYALDFLDNSLEGFAILLFKEVLGIGDEEFEQMTADIREAWDNPQTQGYFIIHTAYAQKPL